MWRWGSVNSVFFRQLARRLLASQVAACVAESRVKLLLMLSRMNKPVLMCFGLGQKCRSVQELFEALTYQNLERDFSPPGKPPYSTTLG